MNFQACLLIYDIPDESGFPNPSNVLRSIAVRVNLSCWVIPEHNIPYILLGDMERAGGTWYTVKFDASEGDKLRKMAIDAITREIQENISRAEVSAVRAFRKFQRSKEVPEKAQSTYQKIVKQIDRRMSRLQRQLRRVTAEFGIEQSAIPLTRLTRATLTIQDKIKARCRLYADAIRQVQGIHGIQNAMAQAGRVDGVPALILADYMDDYGLDSRNLRAAFADEDTPELIAAIQSTKKKSLFD